jgi:chromosome segregation ATPase
MELNLVFMCTTIGALVGTTIGVMMMNRRIRLPIAAAELTVLKDKLQTTETSLAEATASLEDLRKQVAERDQKIELGGQELKKTQAQLESAAADNEKNRAQCSTAELKAQESGVQLTAVKEQRAEMESKLDEERREGVEKAGRVASLEAQLETYKKQNQEMSEQIDGLKAELTAQSRFRDQESRHRAAVEAQLMAEQARVETMTHQVRELESERARLTNKVEEAAKGVELLLMAQENFSRVFKQAAPDTHGNGHSVVKAAGASQELQPVVSPE